MCLPTSNPAPQAQRPPATLENITGFDIAPDGDLELIVGRNEFRIRVRSAVLCSASPILTTMLRASTSRAPNVADVEAEAADDAGTGTGNGTFDHSTDLPSLRLPHENSGAMLWLCGILHQYPGFEEFPTSGLFFATAARAGLYQCVSSSLPVFEAWIMGHLDPLLPIRDLANETQRIHKSTTLFHMLMSSEVLGLTTWFREISKELIMFHDGSFLTLRNVPAFNLNFMWCIAALEEARAQIRALLTQIIYVKVYKTDFAVGITCRQAQAYFKDFSRAWAADVWQPVDQYHSPIFQTFLAVREIATEGDRPNPVAQYVGNVVEQLEERFRGICRHCLAAKPGAIVIGPCQHCSVEFQVEGIAQHPWTGIL